jgi:hypothetical protein
VGKLFLTVAGDMSWGDFALATAKFALSVLAGGVGKAASRGLTASSKAMATVVKTGSKVKANSVFANLRQFAGRAWKNGAFKVNAGDFAAFGRETLGAFKWGNIVTAFNPSSFITAFKTIRSASGLMGKFAVIFSHGDDVLHAAGGVSQMAGFVGVVDNIASGVVFDNVAAIGRGLRGSLAVAGGVSLFGGVEAAAGRASDRSSSPEKRLKLS